MLFKVGDQFHIDKDDDLIWSFTITEVDMVFTQGDKVKFRIEAEADELPMPKNDFYHKYQEVDAYHQIGP